MSITPFFLDLRSAYQSEIDDLTFDSEGRDVLLQRLTDKRKEINFLVQMMELSPEMVAVIFHQGFAFRLPAVMDHLLSLEADEFPHAVRVMSVRPCRVLYSVIGKRVIVLRVRHAKQRDITRYDL